MPSSLPVHIASPLKVRKEHSSSSFDSSLDSDDEEDNTLKIEI